MGISAQPSELWAGIMSLKPFCQLFEIHSAERGSRQVETMVFCCSHAFGVSLSSSELRCAQTPSTKHGSPARTAGRARQKMGCYRRCSHFKLAFLFCGICFQLGQLPDLDKHRSFHIQGRGLEEDTQGEEKVGPPLPEEI